MSAVFAYAILSETLVHKILGHLLYSALDDNDDVDDKC